ncbi:hypothetical protein [Mucilaginibacter sp. OK098]|uniref:hypothetical protein n=1 Tax=Mucilaginibacter sp. OK098 TaxID=1855297 RepID=UPI000921DB5F|nr:hypothetical protein [Mucilaginibacter sp. OK098]SHN13718.1 hypothetical protein SAMN05216524_105540 [Mucilaginibacter sp. OK098]
MDLDYFEVLEYLKVNDGLNKMVSIEPLIDKAVPNAPSFDEWMHTAMKQVNKVLFKLEEDKCIKVADRASPNGSTYSWSIVKAISAELTQEGNSTINKHIQDKTNQKLNQALLDSHSSTMTTNESVREVNKSVIDTNNSMLTISTEQSAANKIIATNSTTQTTILNNQKWILWASVAVAFCSAFISYLNYRKDVPNSQLIQELKVTNKRIDSLSHKLSKTKIDSSAVLRIKKTETKADTKK